MIVYRFEKQGIGPYINPAGWGALNKRRENSRSQKVCNRYAKEILKSPIEPDRYDSYTESIKIEDYLFGCQSKKALRAYFGTGFKFLFKRGFRIKRYAVPDREVIHMGNQVAFPVKYHKLQRVGAIRKRLAEIR